MSNPELLSNEQILSITISDLLLRIYGITENDVVRSTPTTKLYVATWRGDTDPSFHVKEDRLWYDFGLGKGGGVWQFVGMVINNEDKQAIRKYLTELMGKNISVVPIDTSMQVAHKEGVQFHILNEYPMNNKNLLDYLASRGVSKEVAEKNTSVVTYRLSGSSSVLYGIGFKNDLGGYEIRSAKNKIASSPKTITTKFYDGADTVRVFEGFIDYLSFLSAYPQAPKSSYVILNGVANVEKAFDFLSRYKKVDCYLDNDGGGDTCAKKIQQVVGEAFVDRRPFYKGFNDFNDKICSELKKSSQEFKQRPKF